jgi:hypothetical protein
MLQVPDTDKTCISLEQVAERVSQKRRCSVQEVSAALRGDVIPAPEIVDAVVGLRAQRRGGRDSSRVHRILRDEAERLRSGALLSQCSLPDTPSIDQPKPKRFRKGLSWAAGVATAAVISLLVTGVIPQMLGQVVSAAKIKDAIRRGPDIIVSDSLYYPDGSNVLTPVVVPGNYHPSSQLVRELSQTESIGSAAVKRQIHEADGVDIQDIFIRVIMQGNRNERVRILGINPVNLRRANPLDGVLFDIPGSQGEISNIQMDFNLDQPSPHALTVVNSDVITSQPFFEANTISLATGEQAVLIIQASTYCYSASFDLAINYMVGNTTRTDIISNNGHSFRVSAYRFTKTGQLSFRQDFELMGNFSVIPIKPQAHPLPSSLIRACPYFPASEHS